MRYGVLGRRINALFGLLVAAALVAGLSGIAAAAAPLRIVVLGDSLTAGYGLPRGDAFPARLEAALVARGLAARVINAGVSGDTAAGGLARLDWALADKPDIVIVELGANDGLRGLDPAGTRANIEAIVARLKERGIAVLLAGMRAPPNYGPEYGRAFDGMFPAIAEKYRVALYPFFLEGVAARPELNQPDGMHPNRRGVEVIVDRILPYVVRLIGQQNHE
jgi:acyl-CoA thioesterase I